MHFIVRFVAVSVRSSNYVELSGQLQQNNNNSWCYSWCNKLEVQVHVHRISKNSAKLFLAELRQISTDFDNFWQKDGKEAKNIRGALIFHLT